MAPALWPEASARRWRWLNPSCWRNGSVIRSWLIDLMEEAYRAEGGLETILPYIEDTGEVNWLIGDATRMEVAVPVLAVSVMRLFASRDDKGYAACSIAMMRHGFGGHPYGHNDSIVRERREGRVGDLFPGPALVPNELTTVSVAAACETN
jgi:6-phosphogluconate dehydrogenase